MDEYTVKDVIKKLGISKSYLYKVIDTNNLTLDKSNKGRYKWNEENFEKVKKALGNEKAALEIKLNKLGLKQAFINNRRYLGNKYSLSNFIKKVVDENCPNINIVADLFSGTGSVAHIFKEKMLLTNDLLYSNYIVNYAFFAPSNYDEDKIIKKVYEYNNLETKENNYMRENFADTFFKADDCSKIGYLREDIERLYKNNKINYKEYALLITILLYAMDNAANTVGHYDAYRKNVSFDKVFKLDVILPDQNLNKNNKCFNNDIADIIDDINCDLLYLDPPYNSRQYCDAYHLLENVARWNKEEVFGVAKKMDRSKLKSDYCQNNASKAFQNIIEKTKAKYILLSYNNMQEKGNDRSNAKIKDDDIIKILQEKGSVSIFEQSYKTFKAGKSNRNDNKERLFLCKVKDEKKDRLNIACPFNFIGGKFKLLNQIQSLFKETSIFFDLFSGGANVGINSLSSKLILNDNNEELIDLIKYFKATEVDELLNNIDNIIKKYELSNTNLYGYEYYKCNSSSGLASYNKDKYLKLREDYNKKKREGENDLALLYVLILYAFNNQIRFNKKGEFNLPVGKRDFNSKMRSKVILFSKALKEKDISFLKKDFREINLDDLEKDTFFYCDPPYLITDATYNENGGWLKKDEEDLLAFLDKLNKKGFKFALSNVLMAKGLENILLSKWIKDNEYFIHYLNKNYSNSNYQRKGKEEISLEVLITNYKVDKND